MLYIDYENRRIGGMARAGDIRKKGLLLASIEQEEDWNE